MACISKTELVKLQKTLKTDAAIGAKYGFSRQYIHQLRQKYGIESNAEKNKERDDKICNLYNKGKAGNEIAKIIGMSVSQVCRIIKKNA